MDTLAVAGRVSSLIIQPVPLFVSWCISDGAFSEPLTSATPTAFCRRARRATIYDAALQYQCTAVRAKLEGNVLCLAALYYHVRALLKC